jgi:hypothetical protein
MVKLEISKSYLDSEHGRGVPVEDWITEYCDRNNIPTRMSPRYHTGYSSHDDALYAVIVITFKSDWQLQCFIRKGQYRFPYFEFQ